MQINIIHAIQCDVIVPPGTGSPDGVNTSTSTAVLVVVDIGVSAPSASPR